MHDEELEAALAAHFANLLDNQPPPDFSALLTRAEARAARGPRWRDRRLVPMALAAGVVAAVLVAFWQAPEGERAAVTDGSLLVAELTRTTRWQAPSDRWLADRRRPLYLGWPDIHLRADATRDFPGAAAPL